MNRFSDRNFYPPADDIRHSPLIKFNCCFDDHPEKFYPPPGGANQFVGKCGLLKIMNFRISCPIEC